MVTPCRSYICMRPTLEGLIPPIKSILPKGPYLPCVSMVGRALLAGYAWYINPLRWIQNWPHFADDVSKCIFLNENVWISLKISLKIVPEIPINNISPLGQIMAWHWPGNKPISEPMMVSLLTHICVTQPQWVIGIDTNIEVIVVSLTTWEAHHSPRAKPEGCGELPRSLMRQQWPKLRYQFLFYHDETKLMINKQTLAI